MLFGLLFFLIFSDGFSDSGGTSSEGPGGFWTGPLMPTVYAVLGLGVAGAGAAYTAPKVRRRGRTLRGLLDEAERTYAEARSGDPGAGIHRLESLRLDVRQRYERGRLEDTHFLELDKRIGDFIARLRLLNLQREFPMLSAGLMTEIELAVGDGQRTAKDLTHIGKRAEAMRVPLSTRAALLRALGRWTPPAPDAAPAA